MTKFLQKVERELAVTRLPTAVGGKALTRVRAANLATVAHKNCAKPSPDWATEAFSLFVPAQLNLRSVEHR